MRLGAALPAVLFALTMTSALAVGGAFVSRQQAAAARFAERGGELHPLAERVLVETIAAWDSASRANQPVGSVAPMASASPLTAVWVTRASQQLYWLVGEAATASKPVLRRRIGVLVRDSSGAPKLVPSPAWTELP
jgi:hypothetical protein